MKTMQKQILAMLLALLALTLSVGCGGDGSDSKATGESSVAGNSQEAGGTEARGSSEAEKADEEGVGSSSERATFIKKADAVCSKINSEQSAAIKRYSEKKRRKSRQYKTPEEELLVKIVLPNIRKNVEQLDEMETPPGDEDAVQAIVDTNLKAIETTEDNPAKLLATGTTQNSTFAEGTKLSMAYGFKICGQY